MSSLDPQRTRLSLTLVGFAALVATIFGAGWRANSYLRDIRDDVAKMRSEIWTLPQQERWSYQLERANREKGLVVPEPRDFLDGNVAPKHRS